LWANKEGKGRGRGGEEERKKEEGLTLILEYPK